MSNITFYLWNHFSFHLGTTLTASTQAPGFPVSNLRLQSRSLSWQSTSPANQWIFMDFGSILTIGGIALIDSNLTSSAVFRIVLSNNPTMTPPLFDSGLLSPDFQIYSSAELVQGNNHEFFPGGYIGESVSDDLQHPILIVDLVLPVKARYMSIAFDDPTNPQGHVSLSYVFAGITLTPEYGIVSGW